MSIKIHIELGNKELAESLIYNTERFIKRNTDKYTVLDSSLYSVNVLKSRIKQKTYKKRAISSVALTPFHDFLLQ